MKFSIATAWLDPTELPPLAIAAEEAGYHGMSISDHVVNLQTLKTPYPYTETGERRWKPFDPWMDPMVTIGALGAVTERLQFFTNVSRARAWSGDVSRVGSPCTPGHTSLAPAANIISTSRFTPRR